MDNKEKLQKIMANYKSIVAFYPYPSGGRGEIIVETDDRNGREYDHTLKTAINLMVQLGAAVAGYKNDNKTAVKVHVEGIDHPVYFCRYDNKYSIVTEIYPKDGQEPIPIHWNIEY